MNRFPPLALAPICILAMMGCSGIKVETSALVPPEQITAGKKYLLRVQTGDGMLNQFLYEYAYQELSRFLILVEKPEAANGTVDILFTTTASHTTVRNGTQIGASDSWYTGLGHAVGLGIGSSRSTSRVKTQQMSAMIAAVKDQEGRRLWWANLDLSGQTSVATPSEAARHLAKELGLAMESSSFKPLSRN